MNKLLSGIQRFQRRVFPLRRREFEKLADGQSPLTLFITCSDSRIVPHLLTQTDPGELFVLRNAGNLVPAHSSSLQSGEAATIEYAVQVLNVESIVVCGHSHCGAMGGLLNPDSLKELPAVREWLSHAEETREAFERSGEMFSSNEERIAAAAKANVLVQLAHLRTYPAVAQAESRGDLTLHGWFYRFEAGEIFEFDSTSEEFVALGGQTAREQIA